MIVDLLKLAHKIGNQNGLAILGEGNVSTIDGDFIVIKSSGCSLKNLSYNNLTACSSEKLNYIIENLCQIADLQCLIDDSKNDSLQKKPSMEILFHAWILQQEDIKYVAHCHPVNTLRLLCTEQIDLFAKKRIFPDQIVYCGEESCVVPYAPPGKELLQGVILSATEYINKNKHFPRLILLKNHGIICAGQNIDEVLSTVYMCEKSAKIFFDALLIGKVDFLSQKDVKNIFTSQDEKYRLSMVKENK